MFYIDPHECSVEIFSYQKKIGKIITYRFDDLTKFDNTFLILNILTLMNSNTGRYKRIKNNNAETDLHL